MPHPPHPHPDRSATASRVYHGLLALLIVAALATQITLLLTGGADANSGRVDPGTGAGTRLVRVFSYFTVDSNVLVAAACAGLVLDPYRDGRWWRVLRMTSLLGIIVTGLVFVTVLAPKVHLSGPALLCTIAFHYVAPPATLLGWLVLGPRGRADRATLRRSFAWPVAWIAYTLLHGAATGWYPYPFLDVTALGYPRALRNVAAVLLLGAALALALGRTDRALARRR
ncbi:Pr6Pr family membrane protein [Streptomyces sp. NPDC003717]|uniref:Pr6Pr family membrane protein n=1 Tax=Streptomyces sp. NPDC003717 TaxID=3154276 RepID=UPI0033AA648A